MKWKKRKDKPQTVKIDSETKFLMDVWPTFGHDMCDACPQLAKVRVFVPHVALVLDFCSHHFRKHEKDFSEKGYLWIDGRKNHDKFVKTERDIHVERWVGTFG